MQNQLQVFLLPANFESDGMTPHKHGLASKVKFWASAVMSFFRIAGTLEAETLVTRKTQCFNLQ